MLLLKFLKYSLLLVLHCSQEVRLKKVYWTLAMYLEICIHLTYYSLWPLRVHHLIAETNFSRLFFYCDVLVGWAFVGAPEFSLVARVGAALCCGYGLLLALASRSGAQAVGTWAQWFWDTGLVAPRHVASSRTRDRTPAPWIGRWIPTHCTTREVLNQLRFFICNRSFDQIWTCKLANGSLGSRH